MTTGPRTEPPSAFSVAVRHEDHGIVCEISGTLDLFNVDRLAPFLDDLRASTGPGATVVFDVRSLHSVDHVGLRAIRNAVTRLQQQDVAATVDGAQGQFKALLDVSRLALRQPFEAAPLQA